MDLLSSSRWHDYSRACDARFAASDIDWAPWYVAESHSKRRARINIITHLLSQIPQEPLPARLIKLPKRQKSGGYVEAKFACHRVPEIA